MQWLAQKPPYAVNMQQHVITPESLACQSENKYESIPARNSERYPGHYVIAVTLRSRQQQKFQALLIGFCQYLDIMTDQQRYLNVH